MRKVIDSLRRAVKTMAIEGLAHGVVFVGLAWLLASAWRQQRHGDGSGSTTPRSFRRADASPPAAIPRAERAPPSQLG
jgi:hypothetical protein